MTAKILNPLGDPSETSCTFDSGEENDILNRSLDEILGFTIIHTVFSVIRCTGIIYFIVQAWKHARLSKEGQDKYTLYTFVLIGLSSVGLFLGRLNYLLGSYLILFARN